MSNRPKILIVDDRAENLYTLQTVLSDVDAEIVSTHNGNDALKATLNHDFALAILDVQMPVMDGFELAELIRSMDKNEFLPIIFLSAVFSDEYHISKAYKSGAIDFIKKPINETILLSKVNVFLELDRQKQALKKNQDDLEKMVVQLKISNEQHQGIFNAVSESLIVINEDGDIVEANPAACNTYNYTYKEITKLNILNLLKETKSLNNPKTKNNDKGRYNGEAIHIKKNKDEFFVEARFTNFNFRGAPHYLAVIRDISSRIESENEIRNNELRFKIIFESAGVAILEMDYSLVQKSIDDLGIEDTDEIRQYYKDNNEAYSNLLKQIKIKHVNSEALNLFKTKTIEELQTILSDTYLPNTFNSFFDALDEATAGKRYYETETIRQTKEGQAINVIQKWTIPENVTNYNSVLLIIIDITNRKKVEQQIHEARLVAEAANRAKSEFLANMSHEIRTPMNAIIGFSEILADKIDNSDLSEYISGISSSGQNLLLLINDILDLSKLEAGKLELNYIDTNIQKSLSEIHQIFSLKIKEKGLSLIINVEKDFPKLISIDGVRLRQILFNIVGNAVKFTKKGTITINVKSQGSNAPNLDELSRQSHFDLLFEINDTGIGIPEEQQLAIFNPFFQHDGQSTRNYGGTGLGLAITKRLVEMMKGSLSLKSTFGIGSSFIIVFQNVEVIEKTRAIHNGQDDYYKDLVFENKKLLLVDDSQTVIDIVLNMLKDTELNCYTASDGLKAIEMTEKLIPDIILMDLHMPKMDGSEAIERIKNHKTKRLREIPIIALSASVINEETERIQELSDGFIRKPVVKRKLFDYLSNYLSEGNKKIKDLNITANEHENDLSEELIKLSVSDMELFKKHIEDKMLPMHELASKSLSVNNIKKFAQMAIDAGVQYNLTLFVVLGTDLLEQTKQFKFDEILISLPKFKSYTKQIFLL